MGALQIALSADIKQAFTTAFESKNQSDRDAVVTEISNKISTAIETFCKGVIVVTPVQGVLTPSTEIQIP